jgi:hypothetical protein
MRTLPYPYTLLHMTRLRFYTLAPDIFGAESLDQ